MKTLHLKTLIGRSPLRLGFLVIPLMLACFALAPAAPEAPAAPDAVCHFGCDTTLDNTFAGQDTLINNTVGVNNTANGFEALLSNTSGAFNTAIGALALHDSPPPTATRPLVLVR